MLKASPFIERTGPDVRKGKDIEGQGLIDTFGVRGVEFGNWAAGDERHCGSGCERWPMSVGASATGVCTSCCDGRALR
jgi:hypothetical protein